KKLLHEMDIVFKELSKKIKLKLILVSRETVEHHDITVEHHVFDESTFFELLTKADIGIYAMDNSDISRGKMAMKVLDYFAAALPCIASPYGVTPYANHNENCLLAKTKDEWIEYMLLFYNDKNYKEFLGKPGNKTIKEKQNLADS
ncbi:MAG: glycosyltransferase family 4 protein, partial [Bacteroidales bacterium]|nr:glycosyltransferase family 4 protein [Bacteroidales bacterium]